MAGRAVKRRKRNDAGHQCSNCGHVYDPNATHWLCPMCGWKASCCEGAPQ